MLFLWSGIQKGKEGTWVEERTVLQLGAHEQRGKQLGLLLRVKAIGTCTEPLLLAHLNSVYRAGQFPGHALKPSSVYSSGQFSGHVLKCFFADSTGTGSA